MALPGLGPSLRARLVAALGSEDAVEAALSRGDVDAVATVRGISRDRAVRLVLAYRGEGGASWLRTPRAREVHAEIVATLTSLARTPWARNRLELMVPSSDASGIAARAKVVDQWHATLKGVDLDALHADLRGMQRLRDPPVRPVHGIALLVEAEDDLAQLEAAGITRWVEVVTPEDHAPEAELLIYLSRRGLIDPGPEAVQVPFTDVQDVAPWPLIARMTANRRTLEASAAVMARLGRDSACATALEALDELQPDVRQLDDLEQVASEAADRANAFVRSAMAELTLSGAEVLDALSGGSGRVEEVVAQALAQARTELREATGLDLRVLTERFPVEVDVEALETARRRAEASGAVEAYHQARAVCAKLQRLQDSIEHEVEEAHEVDCYTAIELFRRSYRCTPATFGDRLAIRGGLHLALGGQGDPVDYHLDDRVALLTGANSGGKTTLMELLAHVVTLAHMGLPVPADEATVPLLDGVCIFTRPRGLDAGAFESFLTSFEPLAMGDDATLVLADELEAMTELDAAGAILSVLVQRLQARGAYALIVTHMADAIAEHVNVRIDGIEAAGLDEDNALIVDRTPRIGHRARSTPELVLRRLRNTRPKATRALYDEMLEAVRRPAS